MKKAAATRTITPMVEKNDFLFHGDLPGELTDGGRMTLTQYEEIS